MIKCHLSRMLGERKVRISDVVRETGINRGTITRMYYETISRLEIDVIDLLCGYLKCSVGELFEYSEGDTTNQANGQK